MAQLRIELEKHGCDTNGKKKSQLQEELDKKGSAMCLHYCRELHKRHFRASILEVFPTEPLHDLKGHIRNLIEEAIKIATGETLQVLEKTTLSKCTLRGSDYRKALILFTNSV